MRKHWGFFCHLNQIMQHTFSHTPWNNLYSLERNRDVFRGPAHCRRTQQWAHSHRQRWRWLAGASAGRGARGNVEGHWLTSLFNEESAEEVCLAPLATRTPATWPFSFSEQGPGSKGHKCGVGFFEPPPSLETRTLKPGLCRDLCLSELCLSKWLPTLFLSCGDPGKQLFVTHFHSETCIIYPIGCVCFSGGTPTRSPGPRCRVHCDSGQSPPLPAIPTGGVRGVSRGVGTRIRKPGEMN